MGENRVLAFIFERKILKEDDDCVVYDFAPFAIMSGKECFIDDKNRYFVGDQENPKFTSGSPGLEDLPIDAKDIKKTFLALDDDYGLDNTFVYAFPVNIDGMDKDSRIANIEKLKSDMELLKQNPIYQVYNKSTGNLETYFYSIAAQTDCSIDNINYENVFDILSANMKKYGEIKELLVKNLDSINTPSSEYDPKKYDAVGYLERRLYSDQIYDHVRKTVICQDDQIRQIATAIAKNSVITNPALKSNMLVCGPTGVGKSEIFRCMAHGFDIPITVEDSNEYTAASYKGKDVEEILVHLYKNANGDIEKAQKGIVIIDEIDKKVSSSSDHETFTSAVINSFLKMMEGHKFFIEVEKDYEIEFDTSYLTFAFLGAFSGIEKLAKDKRPMGFTTEAKRTPTKEDIYNEDSLIKYGLLPEFIGRNDTLVVLNPLEIPDLEKIIRESDKSQLLLYKCAFENIGIDFKYDDDTIAAIAKKAKELNLGARSIKKIVENALSVANYQALSSEQYSSLTISPKTIEDPYQFVLKK